MKKLLSAILLAIALAEFTLALPVHAADLANGAKIFNANCSACHIGGNNVIIANKTLKKEALEKYGMNSLEAVKTQVSKGKNAMPAFSGRLSESQIEDVASYILEQSQKGW
ncbi:cytochrome c6 PetJ [Pantanalinema sp. GBBB05]|uniref:cytochrome c6 PetJ n=1 Tax=Pantanalinema sp. GBBB05 TaxID=2604139 RepID=UPI001DD02AD3|nr:c-type cytochrome [Pantanalinema sp. GBBB05]